MNPHETSRRKWMAGVFAGLFGSYFCRHQGVSLSVEQQPERTDQSIRQIRYDAQGRVICVIDYVSIKQFPRFIGEVVA